jgi:hypothetical protein
MENLNDKQNVSDNAEKELRISDVINISWDEIFLELRLLRENPKSEWSRRVGEGFFELWLKENFNPPTRKNCL